MNSNTNWGPDAWYKFHREAAKYPDYPTNYDAKRITYFYYQKFLEYIDCPSCKKEYIRIINNNTIKIYSKIDLFMWTVDIHNAINSKLGKKIISYDEAFKLWNMRFPIQYGYDSYPIPQKINYYNYL